MKYTYLAAALLGLAMWFAAGSLAMAQVETRVNFPGMTMGGAIGFVEYGERHGDRMTVTVTFTANSASYAGETIYDNIDRRDLARRIYLKIGDRDFPVWFENGEPQIPPSLVLRAHDGSADVLEVARWQGVFVAPTPEMREIGLYLPQTGLIGPFPVRDTN